MLLSRFIRIQIYNAAGTAVQYDNQTDTNWGITIGSMNLNKILMEEEMHFGQCTSSKFEVQIYGLDIDLAGRKILVKAVEESTSYSNLKDSSNNKFITDVPDYLVADTGGSNTQIKTLFAGYIESSNKDSASTDRNIIAYDWLYFHRDDDISDWWNTYWAPQGTTPTTHTVAETRRALLTELGLTFSSSVYINDSEVLTNPFADTVTKLTVSQVLQGLMEIQLLCPDITTTFDRMEFKGLYTSVDFTVDDNELEGENSSWEDYSTEGVTGIGIYDSSSELAYLHGTTDNVYKIAGNMFLLNMDTNQLNRICSVLLNRLDGLTYTPMQVSRIISNFSDNLGYRFRTSKGYGYVMQVEYSGSGLVDEVLRSVAQGSKLSNDVEDVNMALITGNKFAKIRKDIDGISIDYGNFKTETEAHFSMTDQSIETEVSRAKDAEETSCNVTGYYEYDNTLWIETDLVEPAVLSSGRRLAVWSTEPIPSNYASLPKYLYYVVQEEGEVPYFVFRPIYFTGSTPLTDQYDNGYVLHLTFKENQPFIVGTSTVSLTGFWIGADKSWSTIQQHASEIVLKVDSSGKIVEAALSATPSGSAFKIKADNIDFIANGNIQLTSKTLGIYSTNFQVTSAGAVTCHNLTVDGGSINLGSGVFSVTNAGAVSCSNLTVTGGSLNINNAFKVDTSGKLTCTGADISGKITASDGKIGGWNINSQGIYYNPQGESSSLYPGALILSQSSPATGYASLNKQGIMSLISGTYGCQLSFDNGALVFETLGSGTHYKVTIGKFTFRNGTHYGVLAVHGNSECALIADSGYVYSEDGTIHNSNV